jgi:hypothetical protein
MADPNETLNQGQTDNGAGAASVQGGDVDPAVPGTENNEDLKTLTKDQLLSYAEKIGAKVKPAMSEDKIIQVIEDFQKADADGHPPVTDTGTGAGAALAQGGGDPSGASPSADNGPKKKDNAPVGTIRTVDGVEEVKVSDDKWVPTIRDNIVSDKPVVVVSKKRAGKSIFAKTGELITFDGNGRATVSAIDALYLKTVVIDDEPEFTVEGNE